MYRDIITNGVPYPMHTGEKSGDERATFEVVLDHTKGGLAHARPFIIIAVHRCRFIGNISVVH